MKNSKIKIGGLTLIIMLVSLLCVALMACTASSVNVTYKVDGVDDNAVTVDVDSFEIATAPVKTGFNFIGWFLDKDEWNVEFKSDYYTATEGYADTLTVYAHFVRQKDTVAIPTVTTSELVYTGSRQKVGIVANELYTISSTTDGIKAGKHTSIISLVDKNKYKWIDGDSEDITVDWIIAQAEIEVPERGETLKYTGSQQTANITANDLYTIKDNKAKDVAMYVAVISLNDKVNYRWKDDDSEDIRYFWTIDRAEIESPIVTDALIYTGSEQTANIAASDYYTIGNVSTATEVGTYTAILSLVDFDNYKWKDSYINTTTVEWTIVSDPALDAGLVFTDTQGGLSVTYTGSATMVEIPEQYQGKSIVAIGEDAFSGDVSSVLISVIIPSTVKVIGVNAFGLCTVLESVIFAEGSQLTNIETDAFSNCQILQSIIIPESVTHIGKEAFTSCLAMSSVIFSGESRLVSIGDAAFAFNIALRSIIIPATVTDMGGVIFAGNSLDATLSELTSANINIFTYEREKPLGWSADWDLVWDVNVNVNADVYWSDNWSMIDGVPTPITTI